MSRTRKIRNYINIQDYDIEIDYRKLFVLLKRYKVCEDEFNDISHISSRTMQNIRNNGNITIETTLKILNGLTKITRKELTIDSFITIRYKK